MSSQGRRKARVKTISAPRPRISVAVRFDPASNNLASLSKQSLPSDGWELMLLWDARAGAAPTPDSAPGADALNLRIVEGEFDRPSDARAAAVRAATAPIVACLGVDAVADMGWLEAIERTFEAYGDRAHVVAGQVEPAWMTARPPWLADGLLSYLSVIDLGPDRRFVEPGERIGAGNLAVRVDRTATLSYFDSQLDRAAASGPPGIADAAPIFDPPGTATIVYAPSASVQKRIGRELATQSWLRSRAAWQATIDREFGSPPSDQRVAETWRSAKRFLFELPPHERTLRGLILPQQDPRQFELQVAAIYATVYGLLSGVRETGDV